MLFDGWRGPAHVALVGVLAYITLVAFLRVSGKRTLSKMNAFDFVVTVALGSTLSSALLSRDVTFVDAAVAFALLIGLQYLVSESSLHSRHLRRVFRSEPTLLLYEGRLIESALAAQRVTEDDLRSAVRGAGVADLDGVLAVVLETDGSMSVVSQKTSGRSALQGVEGLDRAA
jgi:uncharacterized membrane protein YcaP (DUF421 family)